MKRFLLPLLAAAAAVPVMAEPMVINNLEMWIQDADYVDIADPCVSDFYFDMEAGTITVADFLNSGQGVNFNWNTSKDLYADWVSLKVTDTMQKDGAYNWLADTEGEWVYSWFEDYDGNLITLNQTCVYTSGYSGICAYSEDECTEYGLPFPTYYAEWWATGNGRNYEWTVLCCDFSPADAVPVGGVPSDDQTFLNVELGICNYDWTHYEYTDDIADCKTDITVNGGEGLVEMTNFFNSNQTVGFVYDTEEAAENGYAELVPSVIEAEYYGTYYIGDTAGEWVNARFTTFDGQEVNLENLALYAEYDGYYYNSISVYTEDECAFYDMPYPSYYVEFWAVDNEWKEYIMWGYVNNSLEVSVKPVDAPEGPSAWYDLNGRTVNPATAENGLYIVRHGNTTRKVMLRR